MPRSKPQNTRRRLESAANHIRKAIVYIHDILPKGEDVRQWDERYQRLLLMCVRLIGVCDYIDSLLYPEGDEKSEEQNNN